MAADIRHVVVLMLENRSFDMMLGSLSPPPPGFNGLPAGGYYNVANGRPYWISNTLPQGAVDSCVPAPDPDESFTDITQQIFDGGAAATMMGFAANYAAQSAENAYCDPAAVMYHYNGTQAKVLHTLAKSFGVSDQWFASAPCQTWPNRFFAHCGTCHGVVDNGKFFAAGEEPFTGRSLFRALEDVGKSWRVYFHDVPQALLLRDIELLAPRRFALFSQFLADAAQGALPAYSFIEPHYFGEFFSAQPPNDQHPPHDMRYGEQLTADVYNAVRQSACWPHTLLIVTYDEHGGCFDHVPPPAAVPPGDPESANVPGFDRYGVRVPALIVSPWIAPGALLQPLAHLGPYPFDHASIIRTVRELNGIAAPLTDRDAAAPSLLPYLTLPHPANDGPAGGIARIVLPPNPGSLQAIASAIPNALQTAMADAAERLESEWTTVGREVSEAAETVAQLAARATAQVRAFLGWS